MHYHIGALILTYEITPWGHKNINIWWLIHYHFQITFHFLILRISLKLSGIFFIMCHKHHLCHALGKTTSTSFSLPYNDLWQCLGEVSVTYNVAYFKIARRMHQCLHKKEVHIPKKWTTLMINTDKWCKWHVMLIHQICSIKAQNTLKISHVARFLASAQNTCCMRLSSSKSMLK